MRVSRLILVLLFVAAAGLVGVSAVGAQDGATGCPAPPAGMNVIVSDAAKIVGTRGPDFICAGPGDNLIVTGGGNDIVYAGDGNDIVRSQGGADQVFGGEGDDVLNSGKGNDVVEGGPGNDRVNGGDNRDTLSGQDGNDRIVGGSGNDIMTGGLGNDAMHGGFGKDSISGEDGRDRLSGNSGGDNIEGGDGDDFINGGSGIDTCLSGETLNRCEVSPDVDADGFMQHEDCNDEDPAVHEGAEEIFGDGIDQDCDGEDANTRPQVEGAEFTINEDSRAGSIVGTVVITELDEADEIAVTIPHGNTFDVFAIDSDGLLTTTGPLNHEGISLYTLAIVVTDRGGLENFAAVKVTVANVNETLTADDAEFVINENNDPGATVGAITATDIDGDTTFSYSITAGDPGGLFAVDATGVLTAAPLDHEATPVHTLTVTVSDGEFDDDATVIVNVNDANEAPVIDAVQGPFSLPEGSTVPTSIGFVTGSDPDDGDIPTWSITNGPRFFSIDGATGELTLSGTDASLAGTVHVIEITLTDGVALTDVRSVDVTVTAAP
ncbi:MAG: hypothetical protein HKN94_04860 [Acidimicrobiales bacterium]|nr:hypothetical protein [Acidimicrobiales bacterium]